MANLTEAEKKWFEELKSCLKKMPKTVEVLVQEEFNGHQGAKSAVHLMKKGVIHESQQECDDLMAYDPNDYSIASASFERLAANNHGY